MDYGVRWITPRNEKTRIKIEVFRKSCERFIWENLFGDVIQENGMSVSVSHCFELKQYWNNPTPPPHSLKRAPDSFAEYLAVK